MKRHLVFVLVLVLCISGLSRAENPAGIVLYFESGSEVYLLLAEDSGKTRGWGAFGGAPHKGERPAETAARETEEETRGYFNRMGLLRKIEKQEPVIDHNRFALFFAEIDFVPAPAVTNNQPATNDRSYFESGPYAWIPFSQVERYVQAKVDREQKHIIDKKYLPLGCETDWLWPIWLGNVRKAVEQSALPWKREGN